MCVGMCGAEYGGGGGGERRNLDNNALDGEIPTEMGLLTALQILCVRPAPPPHLAMWGQLRESRWVGEQGGEVRRVFTWREAGGCERCACGCVALSTAVVGWRAQGPEQQRSGRRDPHRDGPAELT
jgi:hypothetical protein